MDISKIREEYTKSGLRRRDLRVDPLEQFQVWFDQACSAELIEPNAMSLATVGVDGRPSSRTVLLKGFDANGFVFFTNHKSTKAQQIAVNPNVSLLFPWLGLERQVITNGAAEQISKAASLKYFSSRPLGSQYAAWASTQSRVITAREVLLTKLDEIKRKFKDGQVPLPSFWGGYRVVPRTMEFWQGGQHRLHDRFLYTRLETGEWKIERLAP